MRSYRGTAWCSVVPCVAVRGSVLQCGAVLCGVLRRHLGRPKESGVALHRNWVAVVLQCVADVLQMCCRCIADVLQSVAVCCTLCCGVLRRHIERQKGNFFAVCCSCVAVVLQFVVVVLQWCCSGVAGCFRVLQCAVVL